MGDSCFCLIWLSTNRNSVAKSIRSATKAYTGKTERWNGILVGNIGWPCHKSPVMECVSRVKGTSIENRGGEARRWACVFRVALIGLCFVGGGTGGCSGSTSSAVRVYYSNVEQISVVDMPVGLNIRSILSSTFSSLLFVSLRLRDPSPSFLSLL